MHNKGGFFYGLKTIARYAVLSMLFATGVFAQTADSLRGVINERKANDSTKVELITELALSYQDTNPDSVLSIATTGLHLAEKIGFERGRGRCIQLQALGYFHKNDFEKAEALYRTALKIHIRTANYTSQAAVVLSIADIYYRQGKYREAIDLYNKGISIAQKNDNYRAIGLSLISIGGINSDMGSYSEALNYYLKGLGVFEKANYTQGISMTYTNVAIIYAHMGDSARAVDFVNKSLAIPDKNKESLLFNVVNAGVVYAQIKDFKDALVIFKRAALLADTVGDETWKAECVGNIAEAYYHLGQYDSARDRYQYVLKRATEVKDQQLTLSSGTGLGKVYARMGKMKEATVLLKQSLDIAMKSGMKETVLDCAKELGDVSEKTRDYPNALHYRDIYNAYKDSVYNEKSNKRIQQLQFDYELDKKQKEIERNEALARSRHERNNIIVSSLVAVLALFVVIIILLYRSRRYERRNKEEITRQKEEIEHQAVKLEELNGFKDKTFSVLSHDLRGPVGAFTATISLLNENQISIEEFNSLKPELSKQASSLNLLLDNVLGWAKSQMQDQLKPRLAKTNIYHIANENVMMLQDTAERKEIKLENNISETTYAICDSGQMDIVVRNLVMNAIKYTARNGSIVLSAATGEDTVNIMVTDTGIGMNDEQLNNLFTLKHGDNTYGTEGEKGIGLGLILCYQFVKANYGSITVSSEPGKGSTFTITLPRYKAG